MPEPCGALPCGCSSACDPELGEEVWVSVQSQPHRLRGAPGSLWTGLWKRSSPDPGYKWAAQTACAQAHPALPLPALEMAGSLSPAVFFQLPLLRMLTVVLPLKEFQLRARADR